MCNLSIANSPKILPSYNFYARTQNKRGASSNTKASTLDLNTFPNTWNIRSQDTPVLCSSTEYFFWQSALPAFHTIISSLGLTSCPLHFTQSVKPNSSPALPGLYYEHTTTAVSATALSHTTLTTWEIFNPEKDRNLSCLHSNEHF